MSFNQGYSSRSSSINSMAPTEPLLSRIVAMNNSMAERIMHGQTVGVLPTLVEALNAIRDCIANARTGSQHIQEADTGNHIETGLHQRPLFEFMALPLDTWSRRHCTELSPSSVNDNDSSFRPEGVQKLCIEEHHGSSSSLLTNDNNICHEYFVHKYPLWIFPDRLDNRTEDHCQSGISFCLLYNLGLYHHIMATPTIHGGNPNEVNRHQKSSWKGVVAAAPTVDVKAMAKAIACYELSYNLLKVGGIINDKSHWIYTTLAIVNNIGHGHRVLRNDLFAGRCIEQLWSILAFAREQGSMIPASSPPSFLLRGMDGSPDVLDGFWKNALRYCVNEGSIVAPAA
jgi:hypothetical protein